MNLTDGATFPAALIKHTKSRFNQKIKVPHYTKLRIRIIVINNCWATQVVQIFHEERDSKFIFQVNLRNILPKPVEMSHKLVLKIFKYQEPEFYARLFDES